MLAFTLTGNNEPPGPHDQSPHPLLIFPHDESSHWEDSPRKISKNGKKSSLVPLLSSSLQSGRILFVKMKYVSLRVTEWHITNSIYFTSLFLLNVTPNQTSFIKPKQQHAS